MNYPDIVWNTDEHLTDNSLLKVKVVQVSLFSIIIIWVGVIWLKANLLETSSTEVQYQLSGLPSCGSGLEERLCEIIVLRP